MKSQNLCVKITKTTIDSANFSQNLRYVSVIVRLALQIVAIYSFIFLWIASLFSLRSNCLAMTEKKFAESANLFI
ncbi:hypothetical protein ACWIUD_11815 [Helicobacter sp. 23-1044]